MHLCIQELSQIIEQTCSQALPCEVRCTKFVCGGAWRQGQVYSNIMFFVLSFKVIFVLSINCHGRVMHNEYMSCCCPKSLSCLMHNFYWVNIYITTTIYHMLTGIHRIQHITTFLQFVGAPVHSFLSWIELQHLLHIHKHN